MRLRLDSILRLPLCQTVCSKLYTRKTIGGSDPNPLNARRGVSSSQYRITPPVLILINCVGVRTSLSVLSKARGFCLHRALFGPFIRLKLISFPNRCMS
jgi:hypothetical protein